MWTGICVHFFANVEETTLLANAPPPSPRYTRPSRIDPPTPAHPHNQVPTGGSFHEPEEEPVFGTLSDDEEEVPERPPTPQVKVSVFVGKLPTNMRSAAVMDIFDAASKPVGIEVRGPGGSSASVCRTARVRGYLDRLASPPRARPHPR